jgi:hypothetical protein
MFTIEAEFIACYGVTTQAVWMRNFVEYFKIVDFAARPIKIFYNNFIAVFFSKNSKV